MIDTSIKLFEKCFGEKPLISSFARGRVNLIGDQITPYRQKNFSLNDNQFFFDYLKNEIKEKRKMGHLTTLK